MALALLLLALKLEQPQGLFQRNETLHSVFALNARPDAVWGEIYYSYCFGKFI